MKTVGLDGSEYKLSLTGLISNGSLQNKSSFHLEARSKLKYIYPTLQILEEVPVYVRRNELLYLDFFIPLSKKCIEVHGEQHYSFIPFYHRSRLDFLKQQKRDRDKKEWCHLNGITYIELSYTEIETWKEIIINA